MRKALALREVLTLLARNGPHQRYLAALVRPNTSSSVQLRSPNSLPQLQNVSLMILMPSPEDPWFCLITRGKNAM
eukprot:12035899-Heterocapsa_arctica.AAC.1